ncbi:hypothetical protein ABEB36_004638 [Hypothenemus hampei]|uniref:Uncharacterized protein n=1 Tax=Hypothenemus hampei TaxID=57062 RepID=A0ABD1F3Z8_HYPHA
MFGQSPKLGLGAQLPKEFLQKITNGILEETITVLINSQKTEIESNVLPDIIMEGEENPNLANCTTTSTANLKETTQNANLEADAPGVNVDEIQEKKNVSKLDKPLHPAIQFRQTSNHNIMKQANKMLSKFNKK